MAGYDKEQDKRNIQAWKRLFGMDDDEQKADAQDSEVSAKKDSLLKKVKDSDSNRPLEDVETPSDVSALFSKEYKPSETYDPNAKIDESKSADTASDEDLSKLKDRLTADEPKQPPVEPSPSLADMVKSAAAPAPVKSPKSASGYKPARLNDKFDSYYEQAKAAITDAPPAQRDDFRAELEGLKQQYADAQSNLDKRELVETIANALGKIGAGAYGLKTGTDMSKARFDKQDWEAKRDRALKENQLGLSDLADRRKEQIASDQFQQEQGFRKDSLAQQTALAREGNAVQRAHLGMQGDQLAEMIRHNKALEELGGAKLNAAAAKSVTKMNSKELEALNKNAEELATKISGVAAGLQKKDFDEDTAKQQIQTYLMSDLGLSKEQANEVVAEKGMLWGENLRDPSEILGTVNGLFAQRRAALALKSQAPDQALVLGPDGNTYHLPPEQLEEAQRMGYRVLVK